MRDRLFKLTPLGKVDVDIKNRFSDHLESNQADNYHSALNRYRSVKSMQVILKVFLYASIVTSVAATFGLEGLKVIQQIASYIGVSVLFVLYAAVSYVTLIRREYYHLQREILVSEATS